MDLGFSHKMERTETAMAIQLRKRTTKIRPDLGLAGAAGDLTGRLLVGLVAATVGTVSSTLPIVALAVISPTVRLLYVVPFLVNVATAAPILITNEVTRTKGGNERELPTLQIPSSLQRRLLLMLLVIIGVTAQFGVFIGIGYGVSQLMDPVVGVAVVIVSVVIERVIFRRFDQSLALATVRLTRWVLKTVPRIAANGTERDPIMGPTRAGKFSWVLAISDLRLSSLWTTATQQTLTDLTDGAQTIIRLTLAGDPNR